MSVEIAVQEIKAAAEREYFPWVTNELIIDSPEQLKNASDLLALGKRFEKDAEAKLAEITKPLRAEEQAARDAFKPLISRIHLGWSPIDAAIIRYHAKIRREADELIRLQAAEMKAKQQAAEELQIQQMMANAKAAEESKETGEVFEPVEITPMPQPEALIVEQVKPLVRGNMGSTTIKETPDFTIIPGKENDVPRNLCSPDLKKIKAWYAAGFHEIPGVLITMKSHTISRFS